MSLGLGGLRAAAGFVLLASSTEEFSGPYHTILCPNDVSQCLEAIGQSSSSPANGRATSEFERRNLENTPWANHSHIIINLTKIKLRREMRRPPKSRYLCTYNNALENVNRSRRLLLHKTN